MDKRESKKRKLTKKMKRKLAGVFAVTLLAFAGLLTGITGEEPSQTGTVRYWQTALRYTI